MKHTLKLLGFALLSLIPHTAHLYAEPSEASPTVQLIGVDDVDCAMKDGQMMMLTSNHQDTIEVWVDRWFMDVQTADHTKHTLSKDARTTALGCSNTLSGKQHWTIHSVTVLPAQ